MSSNSCSLKGLLWKWRPSSSSSYHPLHDLSLDGKDCLPHCFSFKKGKCPVPVFAGKEERENQVFFVEPYILDHWLFQDLLQKSRVQTRWALQDWDEVEGFCRGSRSKRADWDQPIWLDCDAILFEFFLWLVQNDDPSLRDLNLNDLMEFYDA